MQLFEAPAVRDEAAREPVEQLGMRRRLAELAEVARRADEPAPEMVLPDAVDDHAGGERILRLREPRASAARRPVESGAARAG